MLKMNETPQPKATMMTQKVMRKRKTSCSIDEIDRMIGPKYFVAIPICGADIGGHFGGRKRVR